MQKTAEQKAIECTITTWIQDNRHLPTEEILSTVQHMLEAVELSLLLRYAAQSFVLIDLLTQKTEADDEVRSAYSELEVARKEIDKASRVKDLITKAVISVSTGHVKELAAQRKKANSTRVEKFKTINDQLKQHWQKNISTDKKAPQVAIMLERTDIYKQSTTQPTRAVLERYVRKWQSELK